MVIKRNTLVTYIFMIVVILFIVWGVWQNGEKFTNFDEYIKNVVFGGEKILDNRTYKLSGFEHKTRTLYSEGGTYYNLFDNPNGNNLFRIKYRTEIKPTEIICSNGIIWVKVETKDNRCGWIKSCYIELSMGRKYKLDGNIGARHRF